jgi:hypothetical protein
MIQILNGCYTYLLDIMAKIISLMTASFENKEEKITINYFVKSGFFYNIENYESKEIMSPAKEHISTDGTVIDEQWHIFPFSKKTIIKQEIIIMNKIKNRNKKLIKYFMVVDKDDLAFHYGVFGPVKEISLATR